MRVTELGSANKKTAALNHWTQQSPVGGKWRTHHVTACQAQCDKSTFQVDGLRKNEHGIPQTELDWKKRISNLRNSLNIPIHWKQEIKHCRLCRRLEGCIWSGASNHYTLPPPDEWDVWFNNWWKLKEENFSHVLLIITSVINVYVLSSELVITDYWFLARNSISHRCLAQYML